MNNGKFVGKNPRFETLAATSRGGAGEEVYDRLRAMILSLELEPGAAIHEVQLARELGASRTPLREALIRLETEGLIVAHPNRGSRVSSMELPQIQEHLEAFELLQRTAIVLASQRRSEHSLQKLTALAQAFEERHTEGDVSGMIEENWQFHHMIGLECGNRYISNMYDTTLTDGLRVAKLAMALECYGSDQAYSSHTKDIIREHRAIIDAIARKDAATARKLADSHSNLARLRVTEYISRSLTRDFSIID